MSLNTKKKMTSKQKEARMKNLEKGRMKRMESLKQKKESKAEEYDLSSDADGVLLLRKVPVMTMHLLFQEKRK